MDIPNPTTPLTFLPPEIGNQYQTACYVTVATLGAFMWDWLMSMSEEKKMLARGRWSLWTSVYFASRIWALGLCITSTVLQGKSTLSSQMLLIGHITNCRAMLHVAIAFIILSTTTNLLLFLFRVRAVYGNSVLVTLVFGFLWLAVLATALMVPFATDAAHIGPTQRCINTTVKSRVGLVICVNALTSTLAFIAISAKIISTSNTANPSGVMGCLKIFFTGSGVSTIARGLLRGGQFYYFVMILANIAQASMVFSRFAPVWKAMLNIPAIALGNVMITRVYRAVVLGYIADQQQTAVGSTSNPPFVFSTFHTGSSDTGDMRASNDKGMLPGP
ncbi:hypothetical protein FIBSPDRAFT_1048396 [Athelia psychrophila]|uniref:DUF6533 domain-containing protein n=1 Tax=Athelia psychrophila TaxID=1759441 RepID=A0A166DSC2_9AGAM|nr:hypothetical protein FIBSPDRAFT_1048396 [Fibularhizoctonia sp. CBS 109695]